MDPVTAAMVAKIVADIGSSLFSSSDEAKASKEQLALARERQFIDMLRSDQDINTQNRVADVRAPIAQELVGRVLDPTRMPGGLLAANATPRTYQAAGAPPGTASLTQGGSPASPDELSKLIPDFSRFAANTERVNKLTEGIKGETYHRAPVTPLLNEFERTRGQYLHYGRPGQQAYEEERANQIAGGNPGEAGDAQRARDQFRGQFPQYDLYGTTKDPNVASLLTAEGRNLAGRESGFKGMDIKGIIAELLKRAREA